VGDRWLVAMPLSHVGGLSILVRALFGGGAVVVAPEGQWDANEAVARIARAEVTHASFVPTMLARVVAERRAAPASLRAVLVGGAASPPGLLEDARGLGWPVLPTYGLTEASSQVATRPLGDVDDGAGRIGPPLEGFEVRIVEGEIQIRGPALFSGYVGAEDAFTEDGWFATNDLGRFLTDGSLVVAGRRDDVIITGGENVHPDEIEGILTEHEDVREACVFGLPDAEWGEVVAAALVTTSDAAALAPWLASRFVAHRRPRRIFVVDSLLKRPSGKVDRRGTKRLVMG
jgi:O-succinylbenzoic acid--CoA ligase